LAKLQHSGRRYLPPGDLTFTVSTLDFWKPGGPVNRLVLEPKEVEREKR